MDIYVGWGKPEMMLAALNYRIAIIVRSMKTALYNCERRWKSFSPIELTRLVVILIRKAPTSNAMVLKDFFSWHTRQLWAVVITCHVLDK
jgi:hypothetical protein